MSGGTGPGVTIDGNTKLVFKSPSGREVLIYKGQVWADPDLTRTCEVLKVGVSKGIAQVYSKTDPPPELGDGPGEGKQTLDGFMLMMYKYKMQPILQMVVDHMVFSKG